MDKFNEWFDSKYPNFSTNQDNEFCKTAKDFAYVAFQHQQARLDEALKQTQYALQYVEEDLRGNHEFLQMAMIRTFKALEQALKGEG